MSEQTNHLEKLFHKWRLDTELSCVCLLSHCSRVWLFATPPGSSVYGVLQARIPQRGATPCWAASRTLKSNILGHSSGREPDVGPVSPLPASLPIPLYLPIPGASPTGGAFQGFPHPITRSTHVQSILQSPILSANSQDSFQRESIFYKHPLAPSLASAVATVQAERDLSGSIPPIQEQTTGMAEKLGPPVTEGSMNAVRSPADLGSLTK